MNSKTNIVQELWAKQQITHRDVDYHVWEQKRGLLEQAAHLGHSCLFTVDVYKGRYDFASSGFSELFGYKQEWLNSIKKQANFLEDMTHPDDLDQLIKMQVAIPISFTALPLKTATITVISTNSGCVIRRKNTSM